MCTVSMILDYGQRTPVDQYDLRHFKDLMDLLERGKEYDKKRGEPDCEDPLKAEFLKQIIERLERIEKRLDAQEAAQQRGRVDMLLGPTIYTAAGPFVVQDNPARDGAQPAPDFSSLSCIGTTFDDDWQQKAVGYCPKCGGQWVEAPCASADHQRRRYE